MFDVFLALLFARAAAHSVWRRFPAGLAAVLAGSGLWLALAAAGWYGRGADRVGLMGAWVLMFYGPSAMPGPTARVPASAILAAHPLGAKLVIAAAFGVAFALAWRRAGRFSPLSEACGRWKRLALAYLMPGLLLVGQAVCLALTELAAARG